VSCSAKTVEVWVSTVVLFYVCELRRARTSETAAMQAHRSRALLLPAITTYTHS